MEEQILKIKRWASHGTPGQFLNEMQGKAHALGYKVALKGSTLQVFSERKEGGLLGIGGRTIREVVMQITWGDGDVDVPAGKVNAEFLQALAKSLGEH